MGTYIPKLNWSDDMFLADGETPNPNNTPKAADAIRWEKGIADAHTELNSIKTEVIQDMQDELNKKVNRSGDTITGDLTVNGTISTGKDIKVNGNTVYHEGNLKITDSPSLGGTFKYVGTISGGTADQKAAMKSDAYSTSSSGDRGFIKNGVLYRKGLKLDLNTYILTPMADGGVEHIIDSYQDDIIFGFNLERSKIATNSYDIILTYKQYRISTNTWEYISTKTIVSGMYIDERFTFNCVGMQMDKWYAEQGSSFLYIVLYGDRIGGNNYYERRAVLTLIPNITLPSQTGVAGFIDGTIDVSRPLFAYYGSIYFPKGILVEGTATYTETFEASMGSGTNAMGANPATNEIYLIGSTRAAVKNVALRRITQFTNAIKGAEYNYTYASGDYIYWIESNMVYRMRIS